MTDAILEAERELLNVHISEQITPDAPVHVEQVPEEGEEEDVYIIDGSYRPPANPAPSSDLAMFQEPVSELDVTPADAPAPSSGPPRTARFVRGLSIPCPPGIQVGTTGISPVAINGKWAIYAVYRPSVTSMRAVHSERDAEISTLLDTMYKTRGNTGNGEVTAVLPDRLRDPPAFHRELWVTNLDYMKRADTEEGCAALVSPKEEESFKSSETPEEALERIKKADDTGWSMKRMLLQWHRLELRDEKARMYAGMTTYMRSGSSTLEIIFKDVDTEKMTFEAWQLDGKVFRPNARGKGKGRGKGRGKGKGKSKGRARAKKGKGRGAPVRIFDAIVKGVDDDFVPTRMTKWFVCDTKDRLWFKESASEANTVTIKRVPRFMDIPIMHIEELSGGDNLTMLMEKDGTRTWTVKNPPLLFSGDSASTEPLPNCIVYPGGRGDIALDPETGASMAELDSRTRHATLVGCTRTEAYLLDHPLEPKTPSIGIPMAFARVVRYDGVASPILWLVTQMGGVMAIECCDNPGPVTPRTPKLLARCSLACVDDKDPGRLWILGADYVAYVLITSSLTQSE